MRETGLVLMFFGMLLGLVVIAEAFAYGILLKRQGRYDPCYTYNLEVVMVTTQTVLATITIIMLLSAAFILN